MPPLERVYDGTVEAVNQATMSAQTAGRIAEVFYDVDDYVEPGQPIVRFTDIEQQSALRQAKAALEEALAREKQAESPNSVVPKACSSQARVPSANTTRRWRREMPPWRAPRRPAPPCRPPSSNSNTRSSARRMPAS